MMDLSTGILDDHMKTKGDLSKGNHFEVILPPGLLKETSRTKGKFKATKADKSLSKYAAFNRYEKTFDLPHGVTVIDVDYEQLYPSMINDNWNYKLSSRA